jgi:type VI secretion system protein ImpA
LLNDKVGGEQSLDLAAVVEMIEAVVKTCDSALGAGEAGAANADIQSLTDGQAVSSSGSSSAAAVAGEIRSRQDAIRMLEKVCEFIERTEPSNPAPLLIRRAQRLVSKNFIEIMEDLAPDSLGVIKGIAGI